MAKFSGDAILINFDLLVNHLASEECLFEVESLSDFVETLNILGFQRGLLPIKNKANHLCYRFVNPNFKQELPFPEYLYKQNLLLLSHGLNGKKPILVHRWSNLIQRLMQKSSCKNLRITKLEMAHLRLNYALQKHLDVLRNEQGMVDYQVDDPDYTKNNEIAGYYGNVSIEDLKESFQNFFPIYQETEEVDAGIDEPMQEISTVAVNELMPNCLEEASKTPIEVTPKRPSKKSQHSKKLPRNFLKEMEQALMFLHKETITDAEE